MIHSLHFPTTVLLVFLVIHSFTSSNALPCWPSSWSIPVHHPSTVLLAFLVICSRQLYTAIWCLPLGSIPFHRVSIHVKPSYLPLLVYLQQRITLPNCPMCHETTLHVTVTVAVFLHIVTKVSHILFRNTKMSLLICGLKLESSFSPLETISTSVWTSLYHHLPVLSVFSHVSCQFVFAHIFPVVVDPSPSRPPPPSSLPQYDHVHYYFLIFE